MNCSILSHINFLTNLNGDRTRAPMTLHIVRGVLNPSPHHIKIKAKRNQFERSAKWKKILLWKISKSFPYTFHVLTKNSNEFAKNFLSRMNSDQNRTRLWINLLSFLLSFNLFFFSLFNQHFYLELNFGNSLSRKYQWKDLFLSLNNSFPNIPAMAKKGIGIVCRNELKWYPWTVKKTQIDVINKPNISYFESITPYTIEQIVECFV